MSIDSYFDSGSTNAASYTEVCSLGVASEESSLADVFDTNTHELL